MASSGEPDPQRPEASRPGRAGQVAFAVLGAVVLGWAVLVTVRHAWAGDFRLHLATVEALRRHPWHTPDPLVGAVTGSPYYSPYTVVLGLAAGITGASARTVLEIAGLVNVVLLLTGLRVFCRHLRAGALAPVLAVVLTLLLWGLHPRPWSGFVGLTSLSWTLAYPSTFATGLMLLTWDAFLRHRDRPTAGRGPLAATGLLLALLVLVHPFTALNTVIGLLAFLLADPLRTVRETLPGTVRRRPWWLAGTVVVAGGAVLLWPWSDVWTLAGASGDLDQAHRALVEDLWADHGLGAYGLALAGLPALVTAHRRPFGRELQVLFVLSAAVVAAGAVTGAYGLARVLPVPVLTLQLALAAFLAGLLGTRHRQGPDGEDAGGEGSGRGSRSRPVMRVLTAGYAVLCLAACAAGLYGESGGLLRASSGRAAGTVTTGYDRLLPAITPADVVISDDPWAGRLVNGRGARTVVPAWPYPFVDEAARRRDADAFFAAGTDPRARLGIADRYRITCALVARRFDVVRPGELPGFAVRARSGRRVLLCRG